MVVPDWGVTRAIRTLLMDPGERIYQYAERAVGSLEELAIDLTAELGGEPTDWKVGVEVARKGHPRTPIGDLLATAQLGGEIRFGTNGVEITVEERGPRLPGFRWYPPELRGHREDPDGSKDRDHERDAALVCCAVHRIHGHRRVIGVDPGIGVRRPGPKATARGGMGIVAMEWSA